ncbi:MAG: 16S rRNA (adenine(1518)-N(6)/adenine(1519)-N(6))-dimethyltransferase RsmA [Myxococcota bacterium]|nr:16S rRNA (adenine(1518)-N(6)/adenine(1519)-N(6))-dimethyltransferase RsmA [Myxococcota bacterium]
MTEFGRRAKRSLGQNFLVDAAVIDRIVSAAGIGEGDTVLEIGPGRGALTEGLRKRAHRLVLVEKDDALAAAHERSFSEDPLATVVHRDMLELLPSDLPFEGPYRVVANLPFNVGARITMHLLEQWTGSVSAATLMFQREVADRLVALPATSSYGALSVLVQSFAEVWSLFGVPPGCFRPAPKVQSRVVRIRPRATPLWDGLDYEWFRRVVHGGFAARRKTLLNSMQIDQGLSASTDELRAALAAAEIDPSIRGDSVSVEAWVRLAAALSPQVR